MKVHLFGLFAEALGADLIEVQDVATVTQLRAVLTALHPVFVSTPYRVAVDRRVAADADDITAAHELAALPPFSGG